MDFRMICDDFGKIFNDSGDDFGIIWDNFRMVLE